MRRTTAAAVGLATVLAATAAGCAGSGDSPDPVAARRPTVAAPGAPIVSPSATRATTSSGTPTASPSDRPLQFDCAWIIDPDGRPVDTPPDPTVAKGAFSTFCEQSRQEELVRARRRPVTSPTRCVPIRQPVDEPVSKKCDDRSDDAGAQPHGVDVEIAEHEYDEFLRELAAKVGVSTGTRTWRARVVDHIERARAAQLDALAARQRTVYPAEPAALVRSKTYSVAAKNGLTIYDTRLTAQPAFFHEYEHLDDVTPVVRVDSLELGDGWVRLVTRAGGSGPATARVRIELWTAQPELDSGTGTAVGEAPVPTWDARLRVDPGSGTSGWRDFHLDAPGRYRVRAVSTRSVETEDGAGEWALQLWPDIG